MTTLLSKISSGYIGSPEKWTQYFETVLKDFAISNADEALRISNTAYKNGIYVKSLDELENRLSIQLPKSYRDFVVAGGIDFFNWLTDNLYYNDGTHNNVLYHPNHIGLIKEIDEESYNYLFDEEIEIDDEVYYYSYNSYDKNEYTAADSFYYKREYANFVNIGKWIKNGGIDRYGLVPSELTNDKENEAWLFNPRAGGACRFRCFAELFISMITNLLWIVLETRGVKSHMIMAIPSTSIIFDIDILQKQWNPNF